MTATDHALATRAIDGTLQTAGLLVRVLAYGLLGTFASRYDCGPALLTGVIAGDLLASVVRTVWDWHDGPAVALGELLLLALVFGWVRNDLAWPTDQAHRALLGLAAFGVLAGRVGGTALVRLGPVDR